MSKASTGNHFLAEMTEGPEVDAVFESNATPKPSEGLPDGLENLLSAYQEFWEVTHNAAQALAPIAQVEKLGEEVEPEVKQQNEPLQAPRHRKAQSKRVVRKPRRITKAKVRSSAQPAKQRFGLPEGFVPRMQRYGRGVLLELNIYQLPNGQEFIPCPPAGTLGSRHLYALVTSEQYMSGRGGSIYVRSDARIFDYSVVSANPSDEMFDTGYTIYDLERTGRYAPEPEARRNARVVSKSKQKRKKKKTQQTKSRGHATAG
jgi:hypothetical protein